MLRRHFVALPALAAGMQAQSARPLAGRELLIDHEWIDRLSHASLRLERPLAHGPVLQLNRPWEGAFCGYFTIMPMERGFRAYYRGIPNAGADGRGDEVTCYAESKDGLEWTRPAQNIILKDLPPFSHNFAPFIDKRPGVPDSERFKAVAGVSRTGLVAFSSGDGLKWRRLHEQPVLPPAKVTRFDSQNLAFWSPAEQRYVLYFRTFKQTEKGRVRWVSRTVSDDFRTWAEPVEMKFLKTNGEHAPAEHLYTNQTSAYFRAPHIYVSIAARFLPGRQVLTAEEAKAIHVDPDYFKDCSDAIMMTTRGGDSYRRTFLESFLRPGLGMENWVSRTNYPALNVIQTSPSEMSFYVNRNYGQPTANLARYSLRLDGFSSLQAGFEPGEMVTRPFRLTGRTLDINYATSAAGSVRVEIQDESGVALPGFSLADSREMIGDQLTRTVAWTSGTELGSLQGKTCRLRFQLKDANLYSWLIA